MQYVTISKRGNDYIIQGSTDSGRTVTLDYAEYKEAIDRLAYGVDNQEDKELVEVKKQMEVAVAEKQEAIIEKQEALQELGEMKSLAVELAKGYAKDKENHAPYEVGKTYSFGDTLLYGDNIYMFIGTSPTAATEEWRPDITPSLYTVIGAKDEETGLQELKPSTTNLYNKGDIGTFDGYVWESVHDNNGNPVNEQNGWWKKLGTIDEYLGA